MSKTMPLLCLALLACGATLAAANDGMKSDASHSKMTMDTNGDGMVSRDEYMNYYQSQWDGMRKNKDGMVMMKDMRMMHHDKMMSGHGAMMQGKDVEDERSKQEEVKETDNGGH